jgi:hypothetical protein
MQARIEELADKCTEGRLTPGPGEHDEYEGKRLTKPTYSSARACALKIVLSIGRRSANREYDHHAFWNVFPRFRQ